MKLIKCHISSFGKLKDFDYDFNDGLNSLNKENGWGKSTFAFFIKAMFYGVDSTEKKKSVYENQRLKYRPWNSTEKYGGYIIFERDGKQFKIQRLFGKNAGDDSTVLTELSTGKEFINESNLGARLFGVDEEGFLSTTFLSQTDFEIKSNASLTAKFNKTCDITDTDLFNKSLEKLEEKSKIYKARGDKGLISETKQNIRVINEQIELINSSVLMKTEFENTVLELDDKIKIVSNEIKNINHKISDAGKFEAYKAKNHQKESLDKKIKEQENKVSKLKHFFNGKVENAKKANEFSQIITDYNNAKNSRELVSKDIQNLSANISESPKNNNGFIFLLLSVFALCLGVGLIFLYPVICAIPFAFFIVFTILAIKSSMDLKAKSGNKAFAEMINAKEKEIEGFNKIILGYENAISGFLSNFNFEQNVSNEDALYLIRSNYNEYNESIAEITKLEKEANDIDLSDKPENIKAEDLNINNLQELLNSQTHILKEMERERAEKSASIRIIDDKLDALSDLENKKSEYSEKLSEYEKDFEILELTVKYLKQADENLKIKYRAPLEESLNKYLSLIDKKYKANIDIDFNVSIDENGIQTDTDYYSKGYNNLFDICKRFAITDVVFAKEKPFIILDDPFSNFDKEKINNAIDLIKKMSKEYQIIYFVCHDSRDILL